MVIHPDDPSFEIFSLPRLINNQENIDLLLGVNDSPYHGLTFCTGSLGATPENEQVEMFLGKTQIAFVLDTDCMTVRWESCT